MSVDIRTIQRLIARLDAPELRGELMRLPQSKAIAAIVSQAIADNFAKEGPGWAPLKGSTLRRTVAKGILRVAQKRAAYDMNAIRFGKEGKQSINKKRLKGSMAEFHKKTEKHLERIEKSFRPGGKLGEDAVPGRMILQKTGLLKKAATTAGFSGSNKAGITASNIYRVEGTNLIWGVDLIYAMKHQEGDPAKNLPARPYLVVREEWMARIQNFMVEKIIALLKSTIEGGG